MDPWEILDIYFRDHMYPFTKHHIDTYREFLRYHVPNVIKQYNPITMIKVNDNDEEILKVEVYIGGEEGKELYLDRPTTIDEQGNQVLLTPLEARLKNLTYSTKLFANIEIRYTENDKQIIKKFPQSCVGAIPLMLHSHQCLLHGQGSRVLQSFGEDSMDPGGYFIIDGKEKVIVSQERIVTNRLFVSAVENDPDFCYKAYIRCTGLSGETMLSPRTVEFKLIRTACYEMDRKQCFETPVKEEYTKHQGAILVSLPSIKGNLPLTTVFRALGVETDKDIFEIIFGDLSKASNEFINFIRPSIAHGASTKIFTTEQALDNLKYKVFYKTVDHVKTIIAADVFPNIDGTNREKAMYLGYLVNTLMKTTLGMQVDSDRDSYAFKRVDVSGFLLAQLFQEAYRTYRKFIRDNLDHEYLYGPWRDTGNTEELVKKENLHRLFPAGIITEIFTRSLKGMWGSSSNDPEQGKVQDLSRISYIGFLSHLRRVNLPLDRSIKLTSPHRLHSQQWGIMCPFESPDGASIGYLKNFALMTQITFGTNPLLIFNCLQDLGVEILYDITLKVGAHFDAIRIFVNGSWFGITNNPVLIVDSLRLYRRNGLINPFISVSWNIQDREIRIQTEAGRPCRPLLIIDDSKLLIVEDRYVAVSKKSWFKMLFGTSTLLSEKDITESGYYRDIYISPRSLPQFKDKTIEQINKELLKTQACIEYLDIEEENNMLIAMFQKDATNMHTHMEIHPSTAFSVVTQIVPFANHNQAPRVYFHGAQSKQALGIYATNFNNRFDTMGYINHYPQKRLIDTRGSHYVGNSAMPNGFNVIVAIMTYTGFNQEDGIMINEASIKRGLDNVTAYKTMSATEKTVNANESIKFMNPINLRDSGKEVKGIKHCNYELLNEQGIITKESYIPRGQEAAVIGMVQVRKQQIEKTRGVLTDIVTEETYRDISLVTDVHHYGKIDKIFIGKPTPLSDNRICKVRFRKIRKPELGDKKCLTPEHEVLTTNGWKYINDISLNDNVYTLSGDGSIKIDKPIQLYEYDCEDEELYNLNSQQVDLTVTMDHNMYIKKRNAKDYEIVKAKDIIGKRVSYSKSAININEDYQLILPASSNVEQRSVNMEYFLEFFGFWISDGWARISKRQRANRNTETTDYFVEIAQVKEEDRNRLIEVIKLLDYNPIEHKHCILISNKQLAEFLLPLSVGAPNKFLPEWVWKLSQKQCQYLYNGLRRGDGTVTPSGCDIYYTSSKKLADDVQRLALHCGWSGNIKLKYKAFEKKTIIRGREIVNKYDALAVNIIKTKNNPTVNHGHVKTQNGQSETIVKYTGKVYCIEVPTHVFYVRKNGKPVWTGNCSAHGQKGVVGMIIQEQDMPFTKDGIRPDIIINPHAIPSRMTIGHLVETVFAKLCCMKGMIGDATVFIPFDKNEIFNELEKTGYEKHGNEILYNGRTGQQINSEIFFGPVYYYRLKHMVTDKVHSRDKGPKILLTHQPTSGRSKSGGLRIGEMERDVILAHGLSQFTKECMYDKSDAYKWAICRHCGLMANYAPDNNIIECMGCAKDDIAVIKTPYSFKLLIQELQALGIQLRLSTETIEILNEDEDENEILEEDGNNQEKIQEGGDDEVEDGAEEINLERGDFEKESDEESDSDKEYHEDSDNIYGGGNIIIDDSHNIPNGLLLNKVNPVLPYDGGENSENIGNIFKGGSDDNKSLISGGSIGDPLEYLIEDINTTQKGGNSVKDSTINSYFNIDNNTKGGQNWLNTPTSGNSDIIQQQNNGSEIKVIDIKGCVDTQQKACSDKYYEDLDGYEEPTDGYIDDIDGN